MKPEIAEARGKRILIAAELEENRRLSTSIVKQLCSTDEIVGEKKYKDTFFFTPSHTLILYTNHLPGVGANDLGIRRRLIIVPFNAVIQEEDDVKNYADVLFQESGPAILSWIIEGAQRVISSEFKLRQPTVVLDAISEFWDRNNWLRHFIEEMCAEGEGLLQPSGQLYQVYQQYCRQTAQPVHSTTDFYHALELEGFTRRRTMEGSFVSGLCLNDSPSGT